MEAATPVIRVDHQTRILLKTVLVFWAQKRPGYKPRFKIKRKVKIASNNL